MYKSYHAWICGLASILFFMTGVVANHSIADTSELIYQKTIAALQERYVDEITAHQKYNAYAQRALKENYPNIAHLFRSLAASEAVHARNFKKLLLKLGVEVKLPEKLEYKVASTKANIRHATTVEENEIDRKYPGILKSISSENHEDAIRFITYAWKAEKQHKELIHKIRKASKRFFGIVAERIEGEPTRYYVCQICGSTLSELPAKACPICEHAASEYEEVPGYPGNAKPKDPFDDEDQ